ncbi:MAG: hypothetical protein ACPL7R_03420 [Anaerolineae bacterium]
MENASIRKEILAELDRLGAEQQRRVLDFARALAAAKPRGVPGKVLLPFSGAIPHEDARAIAAAIEEACERVNPDEW